MMDFVPGKNGLQQFQMESRQPIKRLKDTKKKMMVDFVKIGAVERNYGILLKVQRKISRYFLHFSLHLDKIRHRSRKCNAVEQVFSVVKISLVTVTLNIRP